MNVQPAPDASDLPTTGIESVHLSPRHAQAFVRLVETASEVKRRYQFFVWLQSQVEVLLPHALAVCGAYSRQRKQLQFEVFNNIAFPPAVLDALSTADSPLLTRAAQLWVQGQAQALVMPLVGEASPWRDLRLAGELVQAGLRQVMVHGVARPERPHELETLFVLVARTGQTAPGQAQILELILPHLHSTFLRTQGVERGMGNVPVRVAPAPSEPAMPSLTAREIQILHWVREGKSNQEVGQLLNISALTVKNHIQNILRKLGANNRAHAVTLAVRMRILPGMPTADGGGE